MIIVLYLNSHYVIAEFYHIQQFKENFEFGIEKLQEFLLNVMKVEKLVFMLPVTTTSSK